MHFKFDPHWARLTFAWRFGVFKSYSLRLPINFIGEYAGFEYRIEWTDDIATAGQLIVPVE